MAQPDIPFARQQTFAEDHRVDPQGEVFDKRSLQDKFRAKVKRASFREVSKSPAWKDIRLLWASIKAKAECISLEIANSEISYPDVRN